MREMKFKKKWIVIRKWSVEGLKKDLMVAAGDDVCDDEGCCCPDGGVKRYPVPIRQFTPLTLLDQLSHQLLHSS